MPLNIDIIFGREGGERLTLRESLIRYWKYYLGLFFFFPAFVGMAYIIQLEGIGIMAIFVLFFGVNFLAMWPYLKKNAPFSFWIFAGPIWMISLVFWLATFFLSVLLIELLKNFFA